MFKRVEKRRRKQEKEEELGIDEEMKELWGIQDTDSEESASDSDDDSDDGGSSDEEEGGEALGMEGILESSDEASEGDEVDDTGHDGEEPENPEIAVEDALKDPIYLVSIQPEVRSCILCPGKLLKKEIAVEIHTNSNAHKRRLKHFVEFAKDAEPEEDAWTLFKRRSDEKDATTEGSSKRADKKRAHWLLFKEKSRTKKAAAVAKKKAAGGDGLKSDNPSKSKPSSKKPEGEASQTTPFEKKKKAIQGKEEAIPAVPTNVSPKASPLKKEKQKIVQDKPEVRTAKSLNKALPPKTSPKKQPAEEKSEPSTSVINTIPSRPKKKAKLDHPASRDTEKPRPMEKKVKKASSMDIPDAPKALTSEKSSLPKPKSARFYKRQAAQALKRSLTTNSQNTVKPSKA